MMKIPVYNAHVQFEMGDLTTDASVRGPDLCLGVVLAVCTLVGVPGNLMALKYFTTAKVAVLPTYIYISIATIDICSGTSTKLSVTIIT